MLNTFRGLEMAVHQLITNKLLNAIEINNIKSSTIIDSNIFNSNEQIDTKLAPTLRQIAINHLAKAPTPAAKSFRGDHLLLNTTEYQKYLERQAHEGVWGTEIEAVALGEALHVNIVVTSIYSDRSDATWCLHLEAQDAPTIHLYNYKNLHWSNSISAITKGDGNCLFNAIAEGMQELEAPIANKSPLNSNSIFKYGSVEKEAIKKQTLINRAIASALQNHQTPAEKEIAYLKEEERIRKLPAAEQEQIAKDYAYALQLARADMDSLMLEEHSASMSLSKF